MPAPRVTGNSPWHIIFLLDDSGSMSGEPARKLNEAIDTMINEMDLISQGKKPYFRLSFIVFGSSYHVLCEEESEQKIDRAKVTSLSGNSGSTDMAAALVEAAALLKRRPGKPTDFDPFVFLLTDGNPDSHDSARKAAEALRKLEVAAGQPRLVALGLGDAVDMEFLSQVATNPELARHLRDPKDLVKFFPAIGTFVGADGGAAAIEVAIADVDI
jgi:uncharacterized protein YegL